MSAIVLVDTSVLMNVLDVHGFNQQRVAVLAEFERLVNADAHLFIPMASVFEAGNHIAQLANGQVRRSTAETFVRAIQAALNNDAPWKPMRFPDSSTLALWLNDFPEAAMRGLGMGDLSIKKDWEAQCALYPMSRVRVWTLDKDLAGLDRRAH
jgi:predicted nucleic acid-binding protein